LCIFLLTKIRIKLQKYQIKLNQMNRRWILIRLNNKKFLLLIESPMIDPKTFQMLIRILLEINQILNLKNGINKKPILFTDFMNYLELIFLPWSNIYTQKL
jgi:hypothetical protein